MKIEMIKVYLRIVRYVLSYIDNLEGGYDSLGKFEEYEIAVGLWNHIFSGSNSLLMDEKTDVDEVARIDGYLPEVSVHKL